MNLGVGPGTRTPHTPHAGAMSWKHPRPPTALRSTPQRSGASPDAPKLSASERRKVGRCWGLGRPLWHPSEVTGDRTGWGGGEPWSQTLFLTPAGLQRPTKESGSAVLCTRASHLCPTPQVQGSLGSGMQLACAPSPQPRALLCVLLRLHWPQ